MSKVLVDGEERSAEIIMAYLLFVGDCYYPLGGADDLYEPRTYETVQAAMADASLSADQWAHILDLDTCMVVRRFEGDTWTEQEAYGPTKR